MVNNITQNFAMLRRIQQQMQQNKAGPSRPRTNKRNEAEPSRPRTNRRNKAEPSKPRRNKPKNAILKCKRCGANESKFANNAQSGNVVCTNCGVIQSERRLEHQNAHVKNGEVLYARVMVEEEQKIKLLVNLFFNVLFGDLRTETAAGADIAQTYKGMKKYRAKYITKSNIQSAFKGLHMPSIVCCILYCTLLKENRGIPLSIIVSIMNEALSRSRTNTSPINLQTVYLYRTHKKYGFASYLKTTKMPCYNQPLSPSDFITFTCNAILRIQDKNIHKMLRIIGNELFKEYPDRTSPAYIATGVLFYIGNKLGAFDITMFGLKEKELTDMKNKIENSQNPKIVELLEVIKKIK